MHYLYADWPEEPHKTDARIVLMNQLNNYLEKIWLKYNIQDTRYFALMTTAVDSALQADFSGKNDSKVLFLHLVVQMTSYFRPKEDKYSKSKKLDKDLVYGLISYIYSKNRDSLYSALLRGFERFSSQQGSVKSVYKDGFFIENESDREPSEMLKPCLLYTSDAADE